MKSYLDDSERLVIQDKARGVFVREVIDPFVQPNFSKLSSQPLEQLPCPGSNQRFVLFDSRRTEPSIPPLTAENVPLHIHNANHCDIPVVET